MKLTLEPAMLDEKGQQVELLIDSADNEVSTASGGAGGEELLDAAD